MPQEGTYKKQDISVDEAAQLLRSATQIVSKVAYTTVAELAKAISGVNVPVDNAKTITRIAEKEAILLVITLKFRLDSDLKGKKAVDEISNYQFAKVWYQA